MREAIEEYIASDISGADIKGLAGRLGYSESYSGALVKRLTGKSFGEYLKEQRCIYGAELLKTTDLPIGEIIRLTGYENESFFRKIFRKKYGVNPLKYRKREE